jgi:uncharacterized protein YjbI with pentapeptide repeats
MRRLLIALAFLLTSVPAGATVLVVHPDGTGDYPTIQAAIDAAATGDIVELTDGTFTGDGNRDLDLTGKAITVRSASGDPATCILDCGGSATEPHRSFHFHNGETAASEVTGLTITGGYVADEPWGGAMLCELSAFPTVRSCVFQGNRDCALVCLVGAGATLVDCVFSQNYGYAHGAVYTYRATLSMTRCRFIENHSDQQGGGLYNYATTASLSECTFTGNTAEGSGAVGLIVSDHCTVQDCLFDGNSAEHEGAMLVFFSNASIERCTFARNRATYQGAALRTGKSSHATLTNCTFWNNAAPWGSLLLSDGGAVLANCIITANPEGPSMYIDGPAALSCCDIWGNSGGDWVPGIAAQYGVKGNIAEDPQLCDPENGDFTVSESSPCAPFMPPDPECDLIGAWPVGCAATPVTPASWGNVKALFR